MQECEDTLKTQLDQSHEKVLSATAQQFVGREVELARIHAYLTAESKEGLDAPMVWTGAEGIGKRALLMEAARQVRRQDSHGRREDESSGSMPTDTTDGVPGRRGGPATVRWAIAGIYTLR